MVDLWHSIFLFPTDHTQKPSRGDEDPTDVEHDDPSGYVQDDAMLLAKVQADSVVAGLYMALPERR